MEAPTSPLRQTSESQMPHAKRVYLKPEPPARLTGLTSTAAPRIYIIVTLHLRHCKDEDRVLKVGQFAGPAGPERIRQGDWRARRLASGANGRGWRARRQSRQA